MAETVGTIIVPVFNAPHVVRPCLEALVRWTDLDINQIVIVDDGSDSHTAELLREFESLATSIRIVTQPRNLGFVQAVNRGLEEADGEFAVVLNSDTCVTPRWLDKVAKCLMSDPRIAVASPLSNFAPHMAVAMPPGFDYITTARLIEAISESRYPDVTTPEGFCFIVRKSALEDIGVFDAVWRRGYGEESDLAMRARYAGYRTVCVDDTYIYHRGRGTFGQELRDQLYRESRLVFHDRWGKLYREEYAEFRQRDPIGYLRQRIARMVKAQPAIFNG